MTGSNTSDTTDTPVTPITSAPSVLGATSSVTVEKTLTVDERLEAIEAVLNESIVNPPKLPDAEALSNRITSADNKAVSAMQLSGATDSRLTEASMVQEQRFSLRADAIETRLTAIEKTVQQLSAMQTELQANLPQAQMRLVRDDDHERRMVSREFTCQACTCQFSDVVPKAQVQGPRTCPNCGKATDVVITDIPLDTVAA